MSQAFYASVIIPTLNEEKYLPRLLNSLKGVQYPIDIIIIDGGSDDGTVRAAEKMLPYFIAPSSLRVINSPRGVSLQRNMGAAVAKSSVLVFLDADNYFPTPRVYEAMLTAFEQSDFVVAAPLLVPMEKDWRGTLIFSLIRVFQRFLLLFNRPYFLGACIITRKRIFEKTGGFNINLNLGEDADYSLRVAHFGSAGLLEVRFPFSMRRFQKYGYVKTFLKWIGVTVLLMTSSLATRFDYPSGEFR